MVRRKIAYRRGKRIVRPREKGNAELYARKREQFAELPPEERMKGLQQTVASLRKRQREEGLPPSDQRVLETALRRIETLKRAFKEKKGGKNR